MAGASLLYAAKGWRKSNDTEKVQSKVDRATEAAEKDVARTEELAKVIADSQVRENGLSIRFDKEAKQMMHKDRSKVFGFKTYADKEL